MLLEVLSESLLQSDLAKWIYGPKNKSQKSLNFHIQMNGFGFEGSKRNSNFLFVGAILALPTNQESQQDQN